MHPDVLALDRPRLRGTDSNSLLRMYDAARAAARASRSQQERDRAGRAVERIAQELRKRDVPL